MATSKKTASGASSTAASAGTHDNPRDTPPDKPRGGDWREELLGVASQIFDEKLLRRVASSGDAVGRAGDLVLAAHLEDLRLVEEARFHRARRDLGRAMATASKDEIALAREEVRVTGAELGLLRMQRDLATGDLELEDASDGGHVETKRAT